MKLTLDYNGQSFPLNLTPAGKAYIAEVEGIRCGVKIIRASNGRLDIHLSGLESVDASASKSASHHLSDLESVDTPASKSASLRLSDLESVDTSAHVSIEGPRRWVTVNGRTFVITKSAGTRRTGGHARHSAGQLNAPMPGQVRAVMVNEGDLVTRGQTLLLLEAMKMEIRIQSPAGGIVQSLRVKQGQTVERDQALIVIGEK